MKQRVRVPPTPSRPSTICFRRGVTARACFSGCARARREGAARSRVKIVRTRIESVECRRFAYIATTLHPSSRSSVVVSRSRCIDATQHAPCFPRPFSRPSPRRVMRGARALAQWGRTTGHGRRVSAASHARRTNAFSFHLSAILSPTCRPRRTSFHRGICLISCSIGAVFASGGAVRYISVR